MTRVGMMMPTVMKERLEQLSAAKGVSFAEFLRWMIDREIRQTDTKRPDVSESA